MFCECIIVAGGSGSRMNSSVKKQFLKINGKEIISHTIEVFQSCRLVDSIIIVAAPEDEHLCSEIIKNNNYTKVRRITYGGATRQNSVYNGLKKLDPLTDIVVIHDAVRPFVTVAQAEKAIIAVEETGAVILSVPVVDTIKRLSSGGVLKTLDRSELIAVQTPQVFKKEVIMQAYEGAISDNYTGTDDSSLAERIGYKITVVEGSYRNIKITTETDLDFAKAIGRQQFK